MQSQAYDWWVKIASGSRAGDAPPKQPTVEPKYDTLAGLDGVWFWSDFIPVEKGKAYWLTLDVKGPPILVWLVGYPEKGDTSFGADAAAFQEVLVSRRSGRGAPTPPGNARSSSTSTSGRASSPPAAPTGGRPTRDAPSRSVRPR